jgi:hypothetical protein
MKVRCPKCGMLLKFRDVNIGKHGKCPRCHQEIVAQWDDIVRPAPPEGRPGRLVPMPIMWGCVAVFGLCAAASVAGNLAAKPAASHSVDPPAAQAVIPPPVPDQAKSEIAAVPVVPTRAPAAAPEPVPTTSAQIEPIGSSAAVDQVNATTAPPSPQDTPAPRIAGSPSGGTTATGNTIYVGPRGGLYHYSASGRKVYDRRRR